MNSQAIYAALSEPFAPEMERILRKSGTSLTYIPVSEVITRLNKVLGVERWAFEIITCNRDSIDPEYIVAHVRLTWYPDGDALRMVIRDGFGGQKIKRTKQGEIVDLGDEMKGAVSDALKKAAQTLGVGLYLARSEEAMDAEMHNDSGQQNTMQAQDKNNPDTETEKIWDAFMSFVGTFTDEQKQQLRNDWSEFSDGAPIPKKSTVTFEEAEFLHGQAAAIAIGEKFGTE